MNFTFFFSSKHQIWQEYRFDDSRWSISTESSIQSLVLLSSSWVCCQFKNSSPRQLRRTTSFSFLLLSLRTGGLDRQSFCPCCRRRCVEPCEQSANYRNGAATTTTALFPIKASTVAEGRRATHPLSGWSITPSIRLYRLVMEHFGLLLLLLLLLLLWLDISTTLFSISWYIEISMSVCWGNFAIHPRTPLVIRRGEIVEWLGSWCGRFDPVGDKLGCGSGGHVTRTAVDQGRVQAVTDGRFLAATTHLTR